MRGFFQRSMVAVGVCLAVPMTALADVPSPGGCSTTGVAVDPVAAVVSLAVGLGILYAMRRP